MHGVYRRSAMLTYQLRLPQGSSLHTLETRLIAEVWHVLLLHAEWKEDSREHFLRLANITHHFLNRHVKSFTACGELKRCHSNLVTTSWSITPSGTDDRTSQNYQILLLEIAGDMDAFMNELEESIFDDFCAHLPTAQWVTAKTQFDQGIRKAFGPYLLWNAVCEECPRCTPHDRLNPWIGEGSEIPII